MESAVPLPVNVITSFAQNEICFGRHLEELGECMGRTDPQPYSDENLIFYHMGYPLVSVVPYLI